MTGTSTSTVTTTTHISMHNQIKYGDILVIDFGEGNYSEQYGKRPALIVSNNKGNLFSPTVIVVPLTTRTKKDLPTHLKIYPEESGLREESTALFEQIRTVDKKRILGKVGHVDKDLQEEVKKRLLISLNMI